MRLIVKRWLPWNVVLVALGAGIVWRLDVVKAKEKEEAAAALRRKGSVPRVAVASAERRDMVRTIEEIGEIVALERIEIEPKVAGRVQGLMLREGDPVAAGQVIASIRNAELDAQVAEQEARLAEARARLAQARRGSRPVEVGADAARQRDTAASEVAAANVARIARAGDAAVAAARAVVADRQARLDAAGVAVLNAKAQKLSAEAAFRFATARLARLEALSGKGFVSAQDVDNARLQVQVQNAAVEVATGQVEAAEENKRSAGSLLKAAEEERRAAEARAAADNATAEAAAKQAKAVLAIADANLDQKGVWKENLASLEAAVATAQAQLRNIRALKATTVLRSPVDGFLVARYLDNGALCTSAQVIAVVEALGSVRVRIAVPEESAPRILAGAKAEVRLDAVPGRVWPATVERVGRTVEPRTHRVAVEVVVANADGTLRSGGFARVALEIERSAGLVVVPPEAVVKDKGADAVAVVGDDNTVKLTPVAVGSRDASAVAVSGISPGSKVVVRSLMPVRDGKKVEPVDEGDGVETGRSGQGTGKSPGKSSR